MRSLLLLLLSAASLAAQRAPNCALADMRRDGGITMRRYEWHAFDVAQGIAGAVVARKVLRLPVLGAVTITPAVTFALHLNGVRRGKYGADWPDFAFDALLRSAPAFYAMGRSGNTWQSKTMAGAAFAAGYFAGACVASP